MTFYLLKIRKGLSPLHPLLLPPLGNVFLSLGSLGAWFSSHTDRFSFVLSEKGTKGNTKQMNGQKYE